MSLSPHVRIERKTARYSKILSGPSAAGWSCVVLLACVDKSPTVEETAAQDAGAPPVAEHAHDHEVDAGSAHDGGSSHHLRDLEAEPCTPDTWRDLGIDLRECQLVGEDLAGENLRHTNLTDADLSGAILTSVDLFNAKLIHANLAMAALEGANVVGVDFTSANLEGAILIGADLTSAVLEGAVLDDAVTDGHTTCPDGSTGPCW